MNLEAQYIAEWSQAVRESTLKRLRVVPDSHVNWRPTPESMSFADLAQHLIDSDIWLSKKLLTPDLEPMVGHAGLAGVLTSAEYSKRLAQLQDIGEERADIIGRQTQTELSTLIPDTRFGSPVTVWWVIVRGNLDHEVHHRGQIATYLHLMSNDTKGGVPNSSQKNLQDVKPHMGDSIAMLSAEESPQTQRAQVMERLGLTKTVTSSAPQSDPVDSQASVPVENAGTCATMDNGSINDKIGPQNESLIQSYFNRTRHYGTQRFILELVAVGVVSKIFLSICFMLLCGEVGSNIPRGDHVELLFKACIVAPMLETLFGQWLPIWIVGLFTNSRDKMLWLSALFFALLHSPAGIGISVALFGLSLILSWSFMLNRESSRWRAYWVTAVIHALHNLVSLVMFFCIST